MLSTPRTRRALAWASTVSVFAAAAAESCERQTTKVCTTWVTDGPSPALEAGLVGMTATTRSECDVLPGAHVVTLTFEHQRDGRWDTVRTGEPCRTLPGPGDPVDCQFIEFGICAPGQWRVTVLVTGTDPDGRDFAWRMPETPAARVDRCP